jgi:hypothetical protein
MHRWWQARSVRFRNALLCFVGVIFVQLGLGKAPGQLWWMRGLQQDGTVDDARIAHYLRHVREGMSVPVETGPEATLVTQHVGNQLRIVQVTGRLVEPRTCQGSTRVLAACFNAYRIVRDKLVSHSLVGSSKLLAEVAAGQHIGHPVRILLRDGQLQAVVVDDLPYLRRESWLRIIAAFCVFLGCLWAFKWLQRRYPPAS